MELLGAIFARIREAHLLMPDSTVPEAPPVKCSICHDRGWLGYDVRVGHPKFGKIRPCQCVILANDSPDRLDTFRARPGWPDVQAALEAIRTWVRHEGPRMLVIAGGPGVGKTHLTLAAMRFLALEGEETRFETEGSLLGHLHSAMREDAPYTPEAYLQGIASVKHFGLDDLGTVAQGGWDVSHMERLVNLRWEGAKRDRWTIITTNLVGDQMPDRMASRLKDVRLGKRVIIRAGDYRTGR